MAKLRTNIEIITRLFTIYDLELEENGLVALPHIDIPNLYVSVYHWFDSADGIEHHEYEVELDGVKLTLTDEDKQYIRTLLYNGYVKQQQLKETNEEQEREYNDIESLTYLYKYIY